jgi:hypothetical protein
MAGQRNRRGAPRDDEANFEHIDDVTTGSIWIEDGLVAALAIGACQIALAGGSFFSMLNPSLPSTFTAPVFPPSKPADARRCPLANS